MSGDENKVRTLPEIIAGMRKLGGVFTEFADELEAALADPGAGPSAEAAARAEWGDLPVPAKEKEPLIIMEGQQLDEQTREVPLDRAKELRSSYITEKKKAAREIAETVYEAILAHQVLSIAPAYPEQLIPLVCSAYAAGRAEGQPKHYIAFTTAEEAQQAATKLAAPAAAPELSAADLFLVFNPDEEANAPRDATNPAWPYWNRMANGVLALLRKAGGQ